MKCAGHTARFIDGIWKTKEILYYTGKRKQGRFPGWSDGIIEQGGHTRVREAYIKETVTSESFKEKKKMHR